MKYQAQLIIKHLGAVKDINITTNRVNVIIGSQSSGKSTIVKVLSFCQWAEKRFLTEGRFNYTLQDMFQKFHRIGDDYFSKETYVEYNTDAVKISFDFTKNIQIKLKDKGTYYKSKNLYIPAERNFATTIPNLGRYNETNDNIMNLLYDWNEAKKQYIQVKDILNLGLSFSYNEEDDEDYIHFTSENGSKTGMPLRFASSGMQSVTPLVVLYDYLTSIFYTKGKPLSVFEIQNLLKELGSEMKEFDNASLESLKEKVEKIENITKYHFSRFIIEEPEQNLYPQTQKELIYYLLEALQHAEREHQLTITTHSPFVLYSLNNCMMGYLIKEKMPADEQEELASRRSWIDPSLVSVWQLENGTLTSIIDNETRVIGAHSFNTIMNGVMGEYLDMLGYFGYE